MWLPILVGLLLILIKYHRWIYIIYQTLPRDFRGIYRYVKLNRCMAKFAKDNSTVPTVFRELVQNHPKKLLFLFEEHQWTFQQLENYSNQIANYFLRQGYQKGDTVGLYLENRPEYVGIWLGLSKIGVITALINTNLISEPLAHSIRVVNCRALIYGQDYVKPLAQLNNFDIELYEFGTKQPSLGSTSLTTSILTQSTTADIVELTPKDKLLYIYTSGTTGMPKAAVISHTRYIYAATGIYNLTDLDAEDVLYNPLPLFHTAGGMLGIGLGLIFGLTVVLRRKFSASNYWTDCQHYQCTASNYIGEICRYLLAVHQPGVEFEHHVKKMIGNGLRPQMWRKFIETFHVENVFEFYGSTEGNSNLINIDNKEGAVGFIPRYAARFSPVILVRCDEDTGEPMRNADGLCTRCQPGEPGVMVGKINQKHATGQFTGYADEKATAKKQLRDVFQKGDLYFNSGDVLVQDELGYFYFKDRTGDTYRWKGENVATCEVEAVISTMAELKDTVVYGVQIPHTEGRAGMAAIVDPDNSLNISKLAEMLKNHLPAYAIPIFLRIIDNLPTTGTFKLKKIELQKEGFDFYKIKDHRLYFLNSKLSQYQSLTKEWFEDIMSGRARL